MEKTAGVNSYKLDFQIYQDNFFLVHNFCAYKKIIILLSSDIKPVRLIDRVMKLQ